MVKQSTKGRRAVLYARMSPRGDADTSPSIQNQVVDHCLPCCKQNGFQLDQWPDERTLRHAPADVALDHLAITPGIEFDHDVSGAKSDRPGLWRAIDSLRRGDVLVTWKMSRLARDVFLEEFIIREVRKIGATIVCAQGPTTNDDDPVDTCIRQVFAAFNQMERKLTAIRTSAKMQQYQNEDGRAMSAIPPYGQRLGRVHTVVDRKGETRQQQLLEPDRFEQLVIQRIVAEWDWQVNHRGRGSLRGICRIMELSEIEYRGRRRWHHNAVRSILERAGRLDRLPKKDKTMGVLAR